jgi:secondary thiamine-phosphate synthase enzyme
MIYASKISLPRTQEHDVMDITSDVRNAVRASGIREGIVCVFVAGSTGAVTTIEYEPGLLEDLPQALERLFPRHPAVYYKHEERWHDGNGHSHVRASFLGPSITVPVHRGELVLGTWQQVVFVELDIKSRQRELWVQVVGE